MGLQRNSAKGLWEPVQYGHHLEVDIDTATGKFYAPADKQQRLARRQAKQLVQRAGRDARWLSVRELQSLVGRALYMYMAIPATRFYLRELHDVVGSKWGGRVRTTHQLRRDMQWWTAVPNQTNGRPIHRHVETAYAHCDSSGYGWGAVLNGRLEARGFWGAADERRHITWKDLKAVRLTVEMKLRKSGAVATFVAPRWEGTVWHSALTEMAAEERVVYCLAVIFSGRGVEGKAQYSWSAALGSDYLPCAIPSWLQLRRGSVSATLAPFPVRRGATHVVGPTRAPRVP
eukprot:jgi/Tetstr1/464629/TSEL_009383.t1